MTNERRVRQNFIGGLVDTADLAAAGTTLNSAALAAIATTIDTTNHMAITLDPDGIYGAPEIAYITSLTVGATSATILRGQEGTTARAHLIDTPWVHSPTVRDYVPSAAKVTRQSSAQSITSGTDVAISWDTEVWDNDSMVDIAGQPTRVTIKTPGTYRITGAAQFASNATGNRYAMVKLNGSATINSQDGRVAMSGAVTSLLTVVDLVLVVNDYIELYVNQGSGAGLNVGGDVRTAMSVTMIEGI